MIEAAVKNRFALYGTGLITELGSAKREAFYFNGNLFESMEDAEREREARKAAVIVNDAIAELNKKHGGFDLHDINKSYQFVYSFSEGVIYFPISNIAAPSILSPVIKLEDAVVIAREYKEQIKLALYWQFEKYRKMSCAI